MLKVTAEAFHEKLDAGDEEIILNGPPSDLRGHIFLRNNNEDLLSVKTLLLVHEQEQGKILGSSSRLKVSCRLKPGEERLESISNQLPLNTPPGVYESKLMIGGTERKIKMIVQPHMNINIYPTQFSFIGTEAGKVHAAQFTLTNLGNLPFQVPDVKHIAALDMDLICRTFGFALRSKAAEGYTQVMDEIAKNISSSLPDWASAQIEEYGRVLEPGERLVIHLSLTMPKNTDANKDYTGNMRFWDKEITYDIKSYNERKK